MSEVFPGEKMRIISIVLLSIQESIRLLPLRLQLLLPLCLHRHRPGRRLLPPPRRHQELLAVVVDVMKGLALIATKVGVHRVMKVDVTIVTKGDAFLVMRMFVLIATREAAHIVTEGPAMNAMKPVKPAMKALRVLKPVPNVTRTPVSDVMRVSVRGAIWARAHILILGRA